MKLTIVEPFAMMVEHTIMMIVPVMDIKLTKVEHTT